MISTRILGRRTAPSPTFPYSCPRPAWRYPKILVLMLTVHHQLARLHTVRILVDGHDLLVEQQLQERREVPRELRQGRGEQQRRLRGCVSKIQ